MKHNDVILTDLLKDYEKNEVPTGNQEMCTSEKTNSQYLLSCLLCVATLSISVFIALTVSFGKVDSFLLKLTLINLSL